MEFRKWFNESAPKPAKVLVTLGSILSILLSATVAVLSLNGFLNSDPSDVGYYDLFRSIFSLFFIIALSILISAIVTLIFKSQAAATILQVPSVILFVYGVFGIIFVALDIYDTHMPQLVVVGLLIILAGIVVEIFFLPALIGILIARKKYKREVK